LALLTHQRLRGIAIFRTIFFAPVVFPLSLVSVVFMLIFAPSQDGLFNGLMEVLTIGFWEPRDFLHDPWLALPAIMVTSIWQGVGFQMVVLLAGLQDISQELYDAATIDGASSWQRFRHITVPQLRGPLIFVMVVTTIFSFRVFDQIRIMTGGGPRQATTTVLFESVQAAFDRGWVARGAAMSVVFFVIVLVITLIQRKLVPQEDER
jgi:multiple sugar transport system permease protein